MKLETPKKVYNEISEGTIEQIFSDDSMRGEYVSLIDKHGNSLFAGGDKGYYLELQYYDSATRRTLRSKEGILKDDVKLIFLKHFHNDLTWKDHIQWEELKSSKLLVIIFIIIAIIGLLIGYLSIRYS